MKKKTNGYVIGIIILVVMYMSYCGSNLTELYKANYNGNVWGTASLYACINICINTFCIGFYPFLSKMFNRDFYYKHAKIIYLINAIFWIIISIPLYNIIYNTEGAGIGLLGSLIFSVAVYNLLKGNANSNLNIKNDNKDIFKCSECGAICYDGDSYCRNCNSKFDEDTDSNNSEIINKEVLRYGKIITTYTKKNYDNFCNNCGITKKVTMYPRYITYLVIMSETCTINTVGRENELEFNRQLLEYLFKHDLKLSEDRYLLNKEKIIKEHFNARNNLKWIWDDEILIVQLIRAFAKDIGNESLEDYANIVIASKYGEEWNNILSAFASDKKEETSLIEEEFTCDNCGAIVPKNATECPNCGELFDEKESEEDLNSLYEKAEKNKGTNKFKSKDMYLEYISKTEKIMKSKEEKCYTFGNCVEFSIAVEQKEIEDNAVDLVYNTSNAYLNLAIMEFDDKQFNEAIKLLNKSLKYNSCNISAMFELAENYKALNEIEKFLKWTNKCYEKIYHVKDLAHYYRNMGFYYIEKQQWNLAKTVYLYSLKYDSSPVVTTELKYIIDKSKDDSLPKMDELTAILRDNNLPTFISKNNLTIIKNLKSKLEEQNQMNSNVGKFISKLIKENSNS